MEFIHKEIVNDLIILSSGKKKQKQTAALETSVWMGFKMGKREARVRSTSQLVTEAAGMRHKGC